MRSVLTELYAESEMKALLCGSCRRGIFLWQLHRRVKEFHFPVNFETGQTLLNYYKLDIADFY